MDDYNLDVSDILDKCIPFEKPVVPGVYFLIRKDKVVYVGKSLDCHKRLHIHRKNRKMNFSFYYIHRIDRCGLNKKEHNKVLLNMEEFYIRKFEPRYNFGGNPLYITGYRFYYRKYFKSNKTMQQLADDLEVELNQISSVIYLGDESKVDEPVKDKIKRYLRAI